MKQPLEVLAAEIHYHEEEARKGFGLALQHKVAIGKRLEVAKKQLTRDFLPWAKNEFGWSQKHVYRHLELGRNAAKVLQMPPDTSLRMALASIKSEQAGAVEVIPPPAKMHITCEVLEGSIDKDAMTSWLGWMSKTMGAKTKWTIR